MLAILCMPVEMQGRLLLSCTRGSSPEALVSECNGFSARVVLRRMSVGNGFGVMFTWLVGIAAHLAALVHLGSAHCVVQFVGTL